MELINNTTKTLRDDLAVEIKQGSRLSVAAACFSIYAFQELKKELQGIDELRFIFTSPTFTTEKAKKEKREFYIPRLSRERSLYGTEFEVKLRNELTQKAIAKECAEWIRKKVTFKSNVTNENMMGFINLDDKNYMPINGFTTVDLGCERGNNAYSPADFDMNLLDMMADNIKEDRTPEDLLFQVMLDLGVELSSKIEETIIGGKKVFDVADGFLIACFDKDVNDETIKAIAQKQPYYFVMRDSSLANDSVATNFEQIFATYSPDTVRKVL